jgi:hypothetical protein
MLNDGRLLFDSAGELVPHDVSHLVQVYEYEPEGIGSCMTSTSSTGSVFVPTESGCISLISGGTSELGYAVLAGASANGSDVFFTTSQSLVPLDGDEITDMYDAREGGGFPAPDVSCPSEADCRTGISPAGPGPSATGSAAGAEPVPSPVNLEQKAVTAKPLTRAQKLVKALKQCHKDKKKAKRKACEAAAHEKYGPKKKAKRSTTERRAK